MEFVTTAIYVGGVAWVAVLLTWVFTGMVFPEEDFEPVDDSSQGDW